MAATAQQIEDCSEVVPVVLSGRYSFNYFEPPRNDWCVGKQCRRLLQSGYFQSARGPFPQFGYGDQDLQDIRMAVSKDMSQCAQGSPAQFVCLAVFALPDAKPR